MSRTVILETERLVLTPWRPQDVGEVHGLHSDPRVARFYTHDGAPWPMDHCRERLAIWMEEFRTDGLGKYRLVRKSDGAFLGRAGYSFHVGTGEPELGYALSPDHWGKGFATEASLALRDWFFKTRPADDHFIGFAHVENTASRKVLERIGMTKTHVADFSGMPHQFYRYDRPSL